MSKVSSLRGALCASAAAFCAALFLTGCGGSFSSIGEPGPASSRAINISGKVHGGVYPVQQATVRLWETQSNGYGGAAKQLLPATISDSSGNFAFNDYFTCDTGQYAYITVTSGFTATNSVNNNMIQVGVLGDCTKLQSQSAQDNVNVYVSELSTIAAAYALGNFITIDSTNAATGQQLVNISAPATNNTYTPSCTVDPNTNVTTSCRANGLGHAFKNAINLVDSVTYDGSFPTGNARTVSPTNTYSIVPQAEINTIANILQACVDSPGGAATMQGSTVTSDNSSCGALFQFATPPNTTIASAIPTNTLQVAMNMAKYPNNNVAQLFGLQPPYTFFQPYMSQAPSSFTISIVYGATAAGLSNLTAPVDVALDPSDSVYVLGSKNGSFVQGWSADGTSAPALIAPAAGGSPVQLAIDARNLLYINDTSGNVLQGVTTGGNLATAFSLIAAKGLTLDRTNNLWVAQSGLLGLSSVAMYNSAALLKLNLAGLAISTATYSKAGQGALGAIAVDNAQNVWAVAPASSGTSTAVIYGNTGGTGAPNYTTVLTTSLKTYNSNPSLAIDGNGNAFFPLLNSLNQGVLSGGNLLTSNLIGASGNSSPGRSQADGSNAVFWTGNDSSGKVFVYRPASLNASGASSVDAVTACIVVNGACLTSTSANLTPQNLKGLAIDSSGDLWVTSSGGTGELIQMMGLASPSWPLLSYGYPGVKP